MYFGMKSYLKSTRNHTAKHALNALICSLFVGHLQTLYQEVSRLRARCESLQRSQRLSQFLINLFNYYFFEKIKP